MPAVQLTADGCRGRRRRFWERFGREHADLSEVTWAVFNRPRQLEYFAAYAPPPYVYKSQTAHAAVAFSRDGDCVLVADDKMRGYADSAHADERLLPTWYDGVHTAAPRGPLVTRTLVEHLLGHQARHFAVEHSGTDAGLVNEVRLADADATFHSVDVLVADMQRAKDADEVAVLRSSMSAIAAGHLAARRHVKPGMTQLDVYHLIQAAAEDDLGMPCPFYGDCVSGADTATGGGPPNPSHTVAAGDLVLLDFSAVVHGYRGDFANTFVCEGTADDRIRQVYDACMEAIAAGEPLLKPGAHCRDLDAAVRSVMKKAGLGDHFPHHVGHGLGLGHPDPPYIVPESDETLLEGDVVTLEPGAYLDGVGGARYENNYLITADGCEKLSHHELTLDAA